MAPTPPHLKQDPLEPLCNLSHKNPHQGGAPHVQSIFPLLKLFPTHKDLFICLKSTFKKRKIKSCLPAVLQKQLLVHLLFLLVRQEEKPSLSTKPKNVDFFQVV